MKKNRWVFMGALVLALIFGLALTACDNGGGSSFIRGDITGTWRGITSNSMIGTLNISGNGSTGNWDLTATGYYAAGTYTMRGTTAILYSSVDLIPIGTAGLIASDRLVINLNAISGSPGQYTATRVSY
jgi:hypothetical protein